MEHHLFFLFPSVFFLSFLLFQTLLLFLSFFSLFSIWAPLFPSLASHTTPWLQCRRSWCLLLRVIFHSNSSLTDLSHPRPFAPSILLYFSSHLPTYTNRVCHSLPMACSCIYSDVKSDPSCYGLTVKLGDGRLLNKLIDPVCCNENGFLPLPFFSSFFSSPLLYQKLIGRPSFSKHAQDIVPRWRRPQAACIPSHLLSFLLLRAHVAKYFSFFLSPPLSFLIM